MKPSLFLTFSCLALAFQVFSQTAPANKTLQGRVLYQSSGNKPAAGVQVREKDSNGDYSKDKGEYRLSFQTKRNGAALALEIGSDNRDGKKIELVNEKEVKAAKLPASPDELLDIIVCPAGQRDIAAQKYYRILRTTADKELEKKKKEVEGLLAQKDKDYQKISDLFAQLDKMQAALDSAKIREQAFTIASINLDRASKMVKDAVRKIEEENDVEGALGILNAEALDTAYEHASALKKKADAAIKQVIEGYEFKFSLLEPLFKYGEMAECYQKVAKIYEKEEYDKAQLAIYLANAAYFFGENGNYQKELELDLQALSIREKNLPDNHPDFIQSYDNLAIAYINLGDYQKGLEFNLKALNSTEKLLTIDSSGLAQTYNNLGVNYAHLGDYHKALEFNQKALFIKKTASIVNYSDLAQSYNNIADVYNNLGEYQKALEYNIESIRIREKYLAVNHPDLAMSYNNLSLTYSYLGNYQKSLEYNLKAFASFNDVLPPDHPSLAVSYNNLAMIYGNLGEYQKALEFNLKSLHIREKVLPADHPDLADTYNNLAWTHGNLNEHQKALQYNLKTVEIFEHTLPADHPDLATVYFNLAWTYGNLGNSQNALEFNQKALVIREKVLPADHPDLARSYGRQAFTYANLGDNEKALQLNLKALVIWEKVLPADHPDLASLYNNLAATYSNLRNYQKALEFNLRAMEIREKSLPANHPDLALTYNNIGNAYKNVGNGQKGIEYIRKSITIGENSEPKPPYLNQFYSNLGIFCARARLFSEAKEALESSEHLKKDIGLYQGWAIYYGLQNDKIKTFENMQKAVELGCNDVRWITTDESLACIRDWAAYKKIVEQLQKQ